mgnify:CR=1 FL=1
MKKTLSVFLSAFMILSFVYVLFSAQVHADEEIKVGSTVLFGSYEQDNDTSNGSEAIKWRVLSIDEENGTALLLSTYILDVGQFNDKSGPIYWENSYMRDWLNSYFLQTAFSEEESSSLILSKVKAENNPKYPDIYPDILESKGVKAHHNVGGLPEDLHFELVEPIKLLFKDEVRKVGLELGLPSHLVNRQPFPGPGLGVLLAYAFFCKDKTTKQSAPGAIIIHFLGGIHEIYFPYILMNPLVIIAPIVGNICAITFFMLTNSRFHLWIICPLASTEYTYFFIIVHRSIFST